MHWHMLPREVVLESPSQRCPGAVMSSKAVGSAGGRRMVGLDDHGALFQP